LVLPTRITTAEANVQLQLEDIRRRVRRLERLVEGLSKEIALWRGEESLLLFGERQRYLKEVHNALFGADAARIILERVVQRMEGADPASQLPERT
jgi:hypothetical protein